jgi:hypothetical protein
MMDHKIIYADCSESDDGGRTYRDKRHLAILMPERFPWLSMSVASSPTIDIPHEDVTDEPKQLP